MREKLGDGRTEAKRVNLKYVLKKTNLWAWESDISAPYAGSVARTTMRSIVTTQPPALALPSDFVLSKNKQEEEQEQRTDALQGLQPREMKGASSALV